KIRTGTSGVRVEINVNGDGAMRAFNASGQQTFGVVNGEAELTGKVIALSGKIGEWSIDTDNALRATGVDARFILSNAGYFAAIGVNVLLATNPNRATARFVQSSNNSIGDNIA